MQVCAHTSFNRAWGSSQSAAQGESDDVRSLASLARKASPTAWIASFDTLPLHRAATRGSSITLWSTTFVGFRLGDDLGHRTMVTARNTDSTRRKGIGPAVVEAVNPARAL